ncbi:putative ATP-dependent RNA helicase ddx56, partial [Phlyctochytrium planicorne]
MDLEEPLEKKAPQRRAKKAPAPNATIVNDEQVGSFSDLGLDPRVLKAIAKLGFSKPTLVQVSAIPLALKGKDILARARTGSGKTLAYCIPLIQKILAVKE